MGSGNNNAQRNAERTEAERIRRIQEGSGEVNRVYDDPRREGQIGDVITAVRDDFMERLNNDKADTDRQGKFAMARSGQAGGSVQRDFGTRVGKQYQRGVLDVERRAQGVGSSLRQQDNSARQELLMMVQGGLDMSTARQQAASGMQNTLQSGRSQALTDDVGNAFGTFADLFKRSQESAAARRAELNMYNTIYQSGPWSLKPPGGR